MNHKIITTMAAIALTGSIATEAASRRWQGGDGNWAEAANWDTPPLVADNARFQTDGDNATINSDVGGIAVLQLGFGGGGITTTMNIEEGAAITIDRLRAGNTADTTGIINMSGGRLTTYHGNNGIGYAGAGALNLSGGIFTATNNLQIARSAGAVGSATISGGILNVDQALKVASHTETAIGTLSVLGGEVNARSLAVGQNGTGIVTLDGTGVLNTDLLTIGGGEGGTAILSGGQATIGKMAIGSSGILRIETGAELQAGLNLLIESDGLFEWEGEHCDELLAMISSGSLIWSNAVTAYDDSKAFSQEFELDGQFLRTHYDTTSNTTEVWAVIPEPATLSLIAVVGGFVLFMRRLD